MAAKPQLTPPGGVSSDTLIFVATTPCCLADTRSGSGYPGLTAAVIVWQANTPYLSNAAIVAANLSDSSASVADGGNSTGVDVVVDVNGYFAAPTDLNVNTGVGLQTLGHDTVGSYNTASGVGALGNNNERGPQHSEWLRRVRQQYSRCD